MNQTPEKLAERIVKHVWCDLGALSSMNNLKFKMTKKQKSDVFKSWVSTIADMIKMADSNQYYTAFFDGSARPNPGEMSIGGYIQTPNKEVIYQYSIKLGHGTNNIAEYQSLIHVLRECRRRGIQLVNIKGDSQLVINQVNETWKCKDKHISSLCEEAKQIKNDLIDCTLMWEPRKQNAEADRLATEAHS
jgi:ribonuclease HI